MTMHRRFARWAAALTLLTGSSVSALAAQGGVQEAELDLLIVNGRVLDGTGNPEFRADIGIRGDQIVLIARSLAGTPARRVIDAAGLYVVPGFIDVHSHADRSLVTDDAEARRAANLLTQGITTIVGGPDGRNARWPIAAEIAAYERPGVAVNVVPMVGHGTVRGEVMGADYERAATDAEIERMRTLVRQGMEQGAWGLGAGPEYRPGRFSTTEEIIALANVVGEYDGYYYAHMRGAGVLPKWQLPSMVREMPVDGQDGLRETVRIAREAGIPVVATHVKAKGKQAWGRAPADILIVDAARREGLQVYMDQYPYDGHSGSPATVVPPWAFLPPGLTANGSDDPLFDRDGVLDDARGNLRRVLADSALRRTFDRDLAYAIDYNGGADRILVASHPDSTLIGESVAEIAAARDTTAAAVLIDIALTGDPSDLQGALYRPLSLHEADVYARDRGAITLAHAIRSSTGLPAQIIGLPDRGYLREGQKADIAIFDYARIADRATQIDAGQHSEGIEYLLVNGQLAIDGGTPTGGLHGVVIKRHEVQRSSAARAALTTDRR